MSNESTSIRYYKPKVQTASFNAKSKEAEDATMVCSMLLLYVVLLQLLHTGSAIENLDFEILL